MHILDLPIELIFIILDYLNYEELYCISGLLCRRFIDIFNAYRADRSVDIGCGQARNLYKSVSNGVQLHTLRIQNASCNDVYCIEKILDMNNLKKLTISMSTSKDCIDCISRGLIDNTSCTYLSLEDVPLYYISFYLLCSKLKNITHLVLINIGMVDRHFEMLCNGVLNESSVESLDVSKNLIQGSHTVCIMHRLKYLNLSKNLINFDSILVISKAMNTTEIKQLDVSYNHIPKHGVLCLLKALETNKTLESLKCNVHDWRHSTYRYMSKKEKRVYISQLNSFDVVRREDVMNYESSIDEKIYSILRENKNLKRFDLAYVDHYDTVQHIRFNAMLGKLCMQINVFDIYREMNEIDVGNLFENENAEYVLSYLEGYKFRDILLKWDGQFELGRAQISKLLERNEHIVNFDVEISKCIKIKLK